MKKETMYQIAIRAFARQCLENGTDTCTYPPLDDIASRTEKTFLNRYIKKLNGEIEDLKFFDLTERIPLLEKTLQICNDRLNVLNIKF